MLFLENENTLTINYEGITTHVSYCIADFAGNVLMRGEFNEIRDNKISIRSLKSGTYTLCIIDGDSLVKKKFIKDQISEKSVILPKASVSKGT